MGERQLSPGFQGAQAFNNLPPHLKEVDSVVIFKTLLNDIIFLEFL